MANATEALFMLLMTISGFTLLIAVVSALIGLFSEDDTNKNKFFAIASKSLLVFVLTFVIGFGTCVAMF